LTKKRVLQNIFGVRSDATAELLPRTTNTNNVELNDCRFKSSTSRF